jgi:hypothetical protein
MTLSSPTRTEQHWSTRTLLFRRTREKKRPGLEADLLLLSGAQSAVTSNHQYEIMSFTNISVGEAVTVVVLLPR